jgi:hypothetical protein
VASGELRSAGEILYEFYELNRAPLRFDGGFAHYRSIRQKRLERSRMNTNSNVIELRSVEQNLRRAAAERGLYLSRAARGALWILHNSERALFCASKPAAIARYLAKLEAAQLASVHITKKYLFTRAKCAQSLTKQSLRN